jgi:hypothetical protein
MTEYRNTIYISIFNIEMEDVQYQTESIQKQVTINSSSTDTYKAKTTYQTEMYNALKFVNELFVLFYVILFSVLHVLFLQQYMQGVKRDEVKDTIWLSFFFFYPYLIYYLEKTIYFGITYVLSLIYGQTYVYEFDKLLLFTDFYNVPNPTNKSVLSV